MIDETELMEKFKLDNSNKSRSCPILPDKLYCFLKCGHKINKAEPLFKRIKDEDVKLLKETFCGSKDVQPDKDAKKKKDKKPAVQQDTKLSVVEQTEK